eukprot:SM000427S15754  [mRNA]  locus=s427:4739:7607:+ [translate_table: standard]
MWGGGKIKDPITDSEDYIWNANWRRRMEEEDARAEAEAAERAAAQDGKRKPKQSGFLSIGRALALNSVDVDLSAELGKATKATLRGQVEAAQQASDLQKRRANAEQDRKIKWNMVPTRAERIQWERNKHAGVNGNYALLKEKVDPQKAAAEAKLKYDQLKLKLQSWTLAIGGGCTVAAYFSYSPEIAASYAVGLAGSLVYVRMLSKSIDSLGSSAIGTAVKGAIGQPRLLVPVVLVMAFNRWNEILVPEYGLLQLQLIPILLGFFTYKAATLVVTFEDVFSSADS